MFALKGIYARTKDFNILEYKNDTPYNVLYFLYEIALGVQF